MHDIALSQRSVITEHESGLGLLGDHQEENVNLARRIEPGHCGDESVGCLLAASLSSSSSSDWRIASALSPPAREL